MKLMEKIKSILVLTLTAFLLANSVAFASSTKLSNLNLSKSVAIIDTVGASEFIDVDAIFNDGTSLNVSKDAEWQTEDPNIAIAYDGRILAKGIGNTVVKVSYNGIEEKIKVNVQGPSKRQLKPHVLSATDTSISPLSLTPAERQAILDKGYSMVSLFWTPTKNLVGWKGRYTFSANTEYRGIPYTQTYYQVDNTGFKNALSKTDFYNAYSINDIKMPKYGNDCSGFVSFSMGLSRQTTYTFIEGIKSGLYPKVGSYNVNSPSYTDLYNSYNYLQAGDAVVMNDHTFLIDYNSTYYKTISAYEQTPYHAEYTTWSYDQMASAKYMPFSKK
ncbi:hypothetical protein [Desulfosporosinus youngiae]|uniref:Ig-like domain-containing protein n=1 Tax=Desulfosporosinus youngiae DSM 17734 TaxID=768710 RepID=H5Y5G7_9FIRM|nr:hypothetical protein [Desulfosporosinus youngiae]EHQ90417.1 hypothetical protein DesyoDRAFT_3393 [Desulfosporosinus youngiae DSM 17734]